LRFLGEGDKVKASLRFRGREMAHQNLGRKVLERLVTEVAAFNGTKSASADYSPAAQPMEADTRKSHRGGGIS